MKTTFLRPRGFSLIEAMITLVVMLLIIGGATAIFVQNQRATTAHITLAMLRANLRFAMETISADLRPIGAFSKPFTPNVLSNVPFPILNLANSGSYTAGLGAYSAYDSTQPDRMRIVYPDIVNDASLAIDYASGTTLQSVQVLGTPFQPCDMALVTNANLLMNPFEAGAVANADLCQICAVTGPTGNNLYNLTFTQSCNASINPTSGFANPYAIGSLLTKVRVWEYYIDQTDPIIPRLMRKEVGGSLSGTSACATPRTPEVVAEYVEDMQVAVGLDSSGDGAIQAGEWVNTNLQGLTVAQMATLRAIRITLIGRTVMVPEVMAGRQVGTQDIYYRRPAVEDHAAGTPGTTPQYREVITEVIQLRNLRPFPLQ